MKIESKKIEVLLLRKGGRSTELSFENLKTMSSFSDTLQSISCGGAKVKGLHEFPSPPTKTGEDCK